jgi:glucose-1-phosphate cytidylyltransferase
VSTVDCQVVILCGGKGTRLREETEYKPKPMVEVGGRPILWHVMRMFAVNGLRNFVICLGYRGEMIRSYFLNYRAMNQDVTLQLGGSGGAGYGELGDELDGCNVTLVDTGEETGTAGRIARVAPYLGGERFLVSYGDGLANLDVGRLVEFHQSHGRMGTVTAVRAISRFGVLELDETNVTSFSEKPVLDDWISAGFFVFEPAFLKRIDDDGMFEQSPLPQLAREGELRAFKHEGFWQPMDTYREYELLNELWATGDAPWFKQLERIGHGD